MTIISLYARPGTLGWLMLGPSQGRYRDAFVLAKPVISYRACNPHACEMAVDVEHLTARGPAGILSGDA